MFRRWCDRIAIADIDLLGFGLAEEPHVHAIFQEICGIECNDGIKFDADSIKVTKIR